jgi:hypothetical protein
MSSATGRDTQLIGYYAHEGIKLVRLDGRTRKPIDREWPTTNIPFEDVERHVSRGGGVGWQCGQASGWLSAVDNDWREAIQLAPRFMPDSEADFQRE